MVHIKMQLLLFITLLYITGGQLMSIPIYGTKRYHRTPSLALPSHHNNNNLNAKNSNPSESSSMPYYNQFSMYHEQQPMSTSLSSYGSAPISNRDAFRHYQNGYITENGYYYYPRHQYQSYGMPTYHGDYKPKPYYYAAAPIRYSYYDDHDISSNPMDDLHEEILHEDERERLRELQQPSYGQENWYQTAHDDSRQQDELTNNFLKNLIEYNRQIDAHQKLQQQQNEELMMRDKEHQMHMQQYQKSHDPYYDDDNGNDDNGEYVELSDYEYEPQAIENLYDIKKYNSKNYATDKQQQQFKQQQQPMSKKPNKLKSDFEDDDVRQLKSLAQHAAVQNQKIVSTKVPYTPYDTYSKPQSYVLNDIVNSNYHDDEESDGVNHRTAYMDDDDDDVDDTEDDDENSSYNQPQLQQEKPITIKSFAQYDNDPEEYDDDAWISWDRKRSANNIKKSPSKYEKWKQSLKKIEAIKAFDDRKPSSIKLPLSKENPKKQSTTETSTSTPTTTTTSTTPTKISTKSPPVDVTTKFNGQKEVVLPRPASVSQFPSLADFPMMPDDFVQTNPQNNGAFGKKRTTEEVEKLKADRVYETIKQLIAMDNQLDENPNAASNIRKRSFVMSEENLVQELNNLKRN